MVRPLCGRPAILRNLSPSFAIASSYNRGVCKPLPLLHLCPKNPPRPAFRVKARTLSAARHGIPGRLAIRSNRQYPIVAEAVGETQGSRFGRQALLGSRGWRGQGDTPHRGLPDQTLDHRQMLSQCPVGERHRSCRGRGRIAQISRPAVPSGHDPPLDCPASSVRNHIPAARGASGGNEQVHCVGRRPGCTGGSLECRSGLSRCMLVLLAVR